MNHRQSTFIIVLWFFLLGYCFENFSWWLLGLLIILFPLWPDFRDKYDISLRARRLKQQTKKELDEQD